MIIVDSKIDGNRSKKNELIPVSRNLYMNISYIASDCNKIFTVNYLFLWTIV